MISTRTQITKLNKTVCLAVATMLVACTAQAQLSLKRQKYDSIAHKYKNEHAVYTDVTERLVISDEDGDLEASSNVIMEKLFISDLSLNTENMDIFFYGDFYPLTDYNGISYIPEKNDYKKIDNSRFGEAGFGHQVFYDDQRIVGAYYTRLTKKSITRTTYSNYHTDLHLLNGFYFEKSIPVLHASFEVTVPDYVKMGFIVKGQDTQYIKRTVEEKNGKITYKFTAVNLPAFRQFSGVPDVRYYMPHVIPYVISFKRTGAEKDSVLAGNTDELYKNEYRYVKAVNLKTDSFLTKKTAELTRNAYSDRDKAARIYEWVQKNMHYVAFENGLEGFIPRPADTVYKRRYGDCKDMASLLEAMCRKAGLKSYFVLIGSDDIPYSFEEVPLTNMFDHMICAVNINDEWIFLDGTDKFLPFGANRRDLQGKEAMIAIDKKNYKIVKIPVVPADRNVITDNVSMHIAYNNISGTVNQHYTGYDAWTIHHILALTDKKEEKDKYVRSLTGGGAYNFLSPNYTISPVESGDMDVSINAGYSIPGYAQINDKQYYVNMNLKNTLPAPRINDTGRSVPYYFNNKKMIRESVVLDIPEGYKVTYLPPNAHGEVDGLWSYKISYKADEKAGKITLTKDYELNTMSISPKDFAASNKAVDELKKLYKETVVLTGGNNRNKRYHSTAKN